MAREAARAAGKRLHRLLGTVVFLVIGIVAVHGPTQADEHLSQPLRLGVLLDSPPFSYIGVPPSPSLPTGTSAGYSVELCKLFAEDYAANAASKPPAKAYEIVNIAPTSERFRKLEAGEIDILCGATTATLARQARYAVSIYTFVTGQGLATLNPPAPPDDATVVGFLAETTSEDALNETWRRAQARAVLPRGYFEQPIIERRVASHLEAMTLLRDGTIDVYVADRAILGWLVADANKDGDAAPVAMVPIALTIEPYALVMRRNDPRIFHLNRFLRALFNDEQAFAELLAEHFPGQGQIDRSFLDLIRFQRALPVGQWLP